MLAWLHQLTLKLYVLSDNAPQQFTSFLSGRPEYIFPLTNSCCEAVIGGEGKSTDWKMWNKNSSKQVLRWKQTQGYELILLQAYTLASYEADAAAQIGCAASNT